MKIYSLIISAITILLFVNHKSIAQHLNNEVKIIGEMKNVMWKGQLYGNINLDTISKKTNLFGLGPVEYLAGEILIIDGKPYKSSVVSDTEMKVEETYHIKAPFFASANIENWYHFFQFSIKFYVHNCCLIMKLMSAKHTFC